MAHDPHQDLTRLDAFLADVMPQLGLDDEIPVRQILGAASAVAPKVMRPGVPVSGYLLGLAVGRGMNLDEALAVLDEAATRFEATHGPDPARRH